MGRWIVLSTYPSRHIAEMMQGLLEGEGVPSIVSVDDAGSLRPDLALVGGARLRVAPEDEDRARAILENGGSGDQDDESPEG